jgi:hypothetical protein
VGYIAVSYKVNSILISCSCSNHVKGLFFFLSLVTYLLWRQLGLKKNEYSALFNREKKKTENDDTVLKLLKIFVEEKNFDSTVFKDHATSME